MIPREKIRGKEGEKGGWGHSGFTPLNHRKSGKKNAEAYKGISPQGRGGGGGRKRESSA